MSTNYDWKSADGTLTLHIGKSSVGWVFSLRIYPELGIETLDDWIKWFALPKSSIVDEYGDPTSVDDMLHIITNRDGGNHTPLPCNDYYTDWDHFHAKNGSEWGPKGLLRDKLGERDGVTHGPNNATYSLISHEFS